MNQPLSDTHLHAISLSVQHLQHADVAGRELRPGVARRRGVVVRRRGPGPFVETNAV